MSRVGRVAGLVAAVVLVAARARGETPAAIDTPPAAKEPEAPRWSFSVSAYTYVVPHARDYAQPTVTADRGWLHLEARYNYEALESGSGWVGYNLSGGDAVAWELTPMIGGVVGDARGIAPGYKGTVSWWKLELFSEGEYFFDLRDSGGSFFYSWSELSLAPVDWGRVGVVGQRTHAYQADREIQRGVLAGVSYRRVDLTTYVFDPDTSDPTVVVAVGVRF